MSNIAARRLFFGAALICIVAVLAQFGYERLDAAGRKVLSGVGFIACGVLVTWIGSYYRKDPELFAVPDTKINRDRARIFGYLSPIIGPMFMLGGALCIFASIIGKFR